MKELSVILPIYNVERYLEKCIRSLMEQGLPSERFEVICVIDGSPDNSIEVVNSLQNEFDNIVLVTQENQGVSVARNVGVSHAKGKYILLIDPDDYVAPNSVEPLLNIVKSSDAQVGYSGFLFLNEEGEKIGEKGYSRFSGNLYSGIEAYKITHRKGQTQADSSVGVIYNRQFIEEHDLHYTPGIPFLEDGEFLARLHCLADKCVFHSDYLYVNPVRSGSATHSNVFQSERARKGFLLAADSLKRFRNESGLSNEQKVFINGPVIQFVLLSLLSAVKSGSFSILRSTVRELKNMGFRKLYFKGHKGYYRFCGTFYNISSYLGIIAMMVYLRYEHFSNKHRRETN